MSRLPARQLPSAFDPVAMPSENWLALLLVAPLNEGAAVKLPSDAVLTVTLRVAALPPGGIGAPLRIAATVTVMGVPPGRSVVPCTVMTPLTKSNEAVKLPDTGAPDEAARVTADATSNGEPPTARATTNRAPPPARPPMTCRRPICRDRPVAAAGSSWRSSLTCFPFARRRGVARAPVSTHRTAATDRSPGRPPSLSACLQCFEQRFRVRYRSPGTMCRHSVAGTTRTVTS